MKTSPYTGYNHAKYTKIGTTEYNSNKNNCIINWNKIVYWLRLMIMWKWCVYFYEVYNITISKIYS